VNVKIKQGGATLVVGLVMLVVLTLLVLSAIRSGNVNMRIVGNMQAQEETAAAAVFATEQIISTNFTAAPAASQVPVTIGYSDAVASASAPVCTSSLAVMISDLDTTNPELSDCTGSAVEQDTGIVYQNKDATGVGRSVCYQQQWEVRATVSDNRTGATATSVQGVSLFVPVGTLCP
jgi:Tfp pilus assembly protein PilX